MNLPKPWDWQRENIIRTWEKYPKRALFAGTRLGKTLVAIFLIILWRKHMGAKRAIVSTLSTACPQWEGWLIDGGLPVFAAYDMTVEQIKAKLKSGEWDDGVIIINHDKLPFLIEALLKWAPEILIGDESHHFRGVMVRRARAYRRLAWQAKFVRILSGTPAPAHYGNLWGQMVGLDNRSLDGGGWGSSYGEYAQEFLIRNESFKRDVLAHRNTERLSVLMNEWCDIKRREDVFGPDNWQPVPRSIEMPAKSWSIYDKLAREWLIEDPTRIETPNILARMLRLQQIASGWIVRTNDQDPEMDPEMIRLHTAVEDAVMADLDEAVYAGEKAVVFHRFRCEGDALAERCKKAFGHGDAQAQVFIINGDVPPRVRGHIIDAFRDHVGSCIAVVQTQSGGTGISFAEAKHVMFMSELFSFDDQEQARDRVYKLEDDGTGGKRAMARTVHTYRAAGTIHEYIGEVLAAKQNIHDSVRNVDRQTLAYGTIRKRRKVA